MNIPKPDGGTRPLGVAAIEDKIVQKAVAETILTPIYEAEFLGFSYGFRPGRGTHNALDALAVGMRWRKIAWVVDCDIRAFFDTISRSWLVRLLEHRIGDRRVIRLIVKWLNAGVMDAGEWRDDLRGTPQGSVISPILANVYLHYVLDLWFQKKWRSHEVNKYRYLSGVSVNPVPRKHRKTAMLVRGALRASESLFPQTHPRISDLTPM